MTAAAGKASAHPDFQSRREREAEGDGREVPLLCNIQLLKTARGTPLFLARFPGFCHAIQALEGRTPKDGDGKKLVAGWRPLRPSFLIPSWA